MESAGHALGVTLNRTARLLAALGLAVLLLIALWAWLVAGNLGSTQAWSAALNTYIGYKSRSGEGTMTVSAVGRATHPEEFARELSGATFGDSRFYSTDYTSGGPPHEARPLPYPPDDIMCVLLQQGSTREVVFVAHHVDLYNADWIVHEAQGAPFAAPVRNQLAGLGCALPAAP
jgi:hypothetical protein